MYINRDNINQLSYTGIIFLFVVVYLRSLYLYNIIQNKFKFIM